ncbi:MAG: hypothetical protein GX238_00800 [Epulopiscium sp.]|nr:hypothetical protein [Candidatus Epulonipiscium sp.]
MVKEGKEVEVQEIEESEKKRNKKGKWIVILVLVFVAFLASLVMYSDFAQIRSQHLPTVLRKIPIVGNLVPSLAEQNSSVEKEEDKSKSEEELVELQETYKQLLEQNQALEKEIKRLKEIESLQLEFQQQKEEFARIMMSQDGFDKEAYVAFYEKLNPEIAEMLYRYSVERVQYSREVKQYAETFQEMDESSAAAILEEMGQTDMALVVLIITHIDVEQRARVLGEMTPKTAATITKQMAPTL